MSDKEIAEVLSAELREIVARARERGARVVTLPEIERSGVLDDVVAAARALGVRDIARRGYDVITLRMVLADAQRMRFDALHAAVALDALFPREGCSWHPTCCWCVESLDVALCATGGPELEHHRINRDTGHDTGCCSFCGAGGRDILVAAVPHDVFEVPPAAFLDARCSHNDGGGDLARLRGEHHR